MKPFPGSFARVAGFTLIELLVSIAVLVLLITLVTQLVNGASSVIGLSDKHMDADSEARLLFNRISVDLARTVKRPDVDYSAFKQPAGTLDAQYIDPSSVPPGPMKVLANLQTSGNDKMAFFSQTDGYFSSTTQPNPPQPSPAQRAPLSLVAYMVDTDPYGPTSPNNTRPPVLRRLGKGLGWEPNSGSWGSMAYLPILITGSTGQWPNLFLPQTDPNSDPDFKTVGSQVFRFEYTYLLKANLSDASGTTYASKLSPTPYWSDKNSMASSTTQAHTSINGFKDVAAIVVALAILDGTSRKVVSINAYAGLENVFPDAVDATGDPFKGDIAAAWQAKVNLPTFAATAGIPQRAVAGVHVYERYFYLNGQN